MHAAAALIAVIMSCVPDPCDLQNIGPDTNLLHLTLEQRMLSLDTAASILDLCRHCLLSCSTAAWPSTADLRLPWPWVVTAHPATWHSAQPPALSGRQAGQV